MWRRARLARPQRAAEAAFEQAEKIVAAERAAGAFRCAQAHERRRLGFDADQIGAATDAGHEANLLQREFGAICKVSPLFDDVAMMLR